MALTSSDKKTIPGTQTTPTKTPAGAPAVRPVAAKDRPRKGGVSWWIWVLFLILACGGAYYFFARPASAPAADASAGAGKHHHGGAGDAVRVVTAVAAKSNIGVYLTGLGSVTPLNTVTVKSRVDGQLMKVLFVEGQMVKEGDLLVQLDARPYQATLEQAQGALLRDQALLQNAQIDLDRYNTLLKQDSIPQQQVATQQALVLQDQGTVKSDQAAVDSANLNITYCNITAPIGGRVGLRQVDQGNQVHASDANGLVVITQLQPIDVVFTIPEDSIGPVVSKLNANQPLAVNAFDRDMKKKIADGTVLTVDNQIDPTTGTLKVKAQFANEDNSLFPNQFVNAKLLVEMKEGVTTVPVAAIQHGTQGTFIYVVDEDTSTVTMENVTVGTIDGDNAEIQKGIDVGNVVVIDGVDKLQNGSKVILPGQGGHQPDAGAAAGSTARS